MHSNPIIKNLYKYILICSFLFHPIFLIGAEKDKFKYSADFSILEFYLIRLYDIEKCGVPINFYSKNYSWCLKQFPKINNSNIELHFVINKNSDFDKNLIKVSPIEKKQIILNEIDDFINYYWPSIDVYYKTEINNQEFIDETQIK